MAPATTDSTPDCFIMGMVTAPVVAALAAELPESMPMSPLPAMATLAGPPRYFPATEVARFKSTLEAPARSKKAPNKRNTITTVAHTPRGIP